MRVNAGPLIKVIAFVTTMAFLIVMIGLVFGKVRLQPSYEYSAVFADSSGIKVGSDVRGDGVAIGSVKSVKLHPGGGVVVRFSAAKSVTLSNDTQARIRYANLTGDRYLDLTQGSSQATVLRPGSTIPENHTQPALDLDQFFQGFDPLMQALDPQQVNTLATNILDVTQGQAGSIQTMLANVGSFTSRLADRDKVIGDTISSLSQALGVIDAHHGDLDQLIVEMAHLTSGLAQDRKVIGSSLSNINTVANDTADLLQRARPGIKANIDNLGKITASVNANDAEIEANLTQWPKTLHNLTRLGAYGSFFDFYLCGVRVKLDMPGQALDVYTPWVVDGGGRCANGTSATAAVEGK